MERILLLNVEIGSNRRFADNNQVPGCKVIVATFLVVTPVKNEPDVALAEVIISPMYPAGRTAPVCPERTGPWTYSALFDGWSSGDIMIAIFELLLLALVSEVLGPVLRVLGHLLERARVVARELHLLPQPRGHVRALDRLEVQHIVV